MIDTIKMVIPATSYSTDKLVNFTTITDSETGEIKSQVGYLKNLRIKIPPRSLKYQRIVVEGSIRKYFLGKNCMDDMTFNDFLKAIDELRKDLDIPGECLNKAELWRVDIGITFQTNHPVSEYIKAIHSHSHIRSKDTFKFDGVQFRGTNKKLIFYNKFKEIRRSYPGQPITYRNERVQTENWLRFEIQYLKVSALQNQLNELKYLIQIPDKYTFLLNLILVSLAKVRFSTTQEISIDDQLTKTPDILAAALIKISVGGIDPLALLNNLRSQNVISQRGYTSACGKLIELASRLSTQDIGVKEELIEEVTEHIIESYQWYSNDLANSSQRVQIPPIADLEFENPKMSHTNFAWVDSETMTRIPDPEPRVSISQRRQEEKE